MKYIIGIIIGILLVTNYPIVGQRAHEIQTNVVDYFHNTSDR